MVFARGGGRFPDFDVKCQCCSYCARANATVANLRRNDVGNRPSGSLHGLSGTSTRPTHRSPNQTSPRSSSRMPLMQAVHEVFIDFYGPSDQQRTRIEVGQVPPGQTRHRDVLSPLPDDPSWDPAALMPRVFFRDSDGHIWMRDLLGRLRVDPGPGNDGFSGENGRLDLGVPRPETEPRG